MPAPYLEDFARTGLDDSEFLVFARCGEQTAIRVEGHAKDDIGMTVDHLHRLTNIQIPYENLIRERRLR